MPDEPLSFVVRQANDRDIATGLTQEGRARVPAARASGKALIATIAELPERCRQAFVLSVFEDQTHAQIAREMGITMNMVEKHIVRAMLACRQCLRRPNEDDAAAT